MQKLWNVKAIVVPVIIGALGSHTSKLNNYLEKLPGNHKAASLIKAALLGSAFNLRRTLDLPENF